MKFGTFATLTLCSLAFIPSSLARLGPNLQPKWGELPSNQARKEKGTDDEGSNRIVGGSVAPEGQYPFFVDWGGCGGSLIHSDIILTAAHCDPVMDNEVYVGAYKEGVGEVHEIETRQMHPQYNDATHEYDFMVIKISTPSGLTPIAINGDGSAPSPGEDLIVMGHGLTTDGGSVSDILLEATVPYIPTSTCNGADMYHGDIVDGVMLCAGYAAGGIDSCQGDSGGPIIEQVNNSYVQVGVVSWGEGCAQPDFPGVYSRISGAKTWIDEQICTLSSNPPPSCGGLPSSTAPSPTSQMTQSPTTLSSNAAPSPTSYSPTTPSPTSSSPPTAPSPTHSSPTVPSSTPPSGSGGQVAVRVDISYDNYPEETGWSIKRGTNVIVDYEPGTLYQVGLVSETVHLDPGQYTFTITDAMGDGICCMYGIGYYEIYADVNGVETLLVEGSGEFMSSQTATLDISGTRMNTSNKSHASPTPAPVQTTSVTQPTSAPDSNCQDSTDFFNVDGIVGRRQCSWLADNLDRFGYLCRFTAIAVACPFTCVRCDLFG